MNTTNRAARRRAPWWAALGLAGLLASACGGDAVEDPSTAAGQPATIDVDVDPGSADDGFVGAVADVTDLECEAADSGGWRAAGRVTNPTEGEVDYRIYVSFVDESNETVGLIEADVNAVAAGAEEEWETEMGLDADDLRCLLRVERVGETADSGSASEDA